MENFGIILCLLAKRNNMQTLEIQTYTIRQVEHQDAIQLLGLFQQLIPDAHLSLEQLAYGLLKIGTTKDNYHFVILERNKIVGSAQLLIYENLIRFPQKKAIIDSVIISEDVRGIGVGTQLLNYLIDFAKKEEVQKVQLISSYKRHQAYSFYRNLGFKDTGLGFILDL